jgi:hypothetical protein
MARTRKPLAVEAHSPYILAAWQKAQKEGGLRLKAGSQKDAISIRYQLYSLRKALKVEGDDLYPLIAAYKISMLASTSTGSMYLEISPGSTHTDKILQEAGIELSEAPDPSDFLHVNEPDDLKIEGLPELEEEEENPYLEGPTKRGKVST